MSHSSSKEIHVIGYALRLPESDSPHEFHENLVNKVNMVTQDERRWPAGHNDTPPFFGKLKQSLDYFDPVFFGMHGKQAEKLDPQLRLLLETSFEALINAAIFPDDIKGSSTGVYIGSCFSDAQQFWIKDTQEITGYELTGCAKTMYANRLSYFYDIHGPSLNVDTACASSLTALHYAVNDLQQGMCETAFVSGSSILLDSAMTLAFNQLHMLSPDGFCKTFDKSANGYTRAEGIVTLLLTTRSDMIRYSPYAKILASSINTCGYHEKGISFPSHQWQSDLYHQLTQQSNVTPAEINHIECHGTGTVAGDTEEILGIQQFFGDRSDLTLGALKSNMGHAEGASGLASIAKVLLSYETQTLYPQLHLHERIPYLGSLRTLTEPETWHGGKTLVNSFGFGGANASVLLEQAPPLGTLEKKWHGLYFISSRTKEGLYQLKRELEKAPQQLPVFMDQRYPWREVAGIPDDPQLDLIETRPLYVVFSGNGSQWRGMGTQLLQTSSLFSDVLSQCGRDIPELLTKGWHGPLDDTRLLTAVQIGLVELLASCGVKADGYVAHSAGEIAASYASGATTLSETMAIAEARGRAAQEMPDGLMVSVGLNRNEILPYLVDAEKVSIACINSPRNVTLSGDREQIERIVQQLQREEIFVRELNTHNKPYHSPLIDRRTVKAHLERAYQGGVKRSPSWLSAILDYSPEEFTVDYHVESVTRPVDFHGAMSHVPANAIALEVGPHSVLRSLIRDCEPSIKYVPLMTKDSDDLEAFKQGIGRLWTLGAKVTINPDRVRAPLAVSAKQVAWKRDFFPVPRDSANERKFKQTFVFDLQGKDAYLLGHRIDRKPIFPAMGYVYIFWQCYLHLHPECDVVTLDDFKIVRSVPLIGEKIRLDVLLSATDTYQLTFNEELVAEAKVSQKASSSLSYHEPDPKPSDTLPKETFYRLCHNEGYHYEDHFQVIDQVSLPDGQDHLYARVHFQEWISFLDGLLQISLLRKQTPGLRLPTSIRHIELSAHKSDSAMYNAHVNTIQCGQLLIEGLETTLAARKKDIETIVFQKEAYFFLGMNELALDKSAYVNDLLAYAIGKFKAIQDTLTEPHHHKISDILKRYDTQVDIHRLAQYPNPFYFNLIDETYAQTDVFIHAPISILSQSRYYERIYHDDFTYDPDYLEKVLSVVRENSTLNMNVFEIGTGTAGFLKQVGPWLQVQDTINCTDITPNRMIHDEITRNLNTSYYSFDLNQDMTDDIKKLMLKADVVVAFNALHVSNNLQDSLQSMYANMKSGAFMLLLEVTSPLCLPLFGMDRDAWHFNDERDFGLWISVTRWKALFEATQFKLISYSTDPNEILTTFFIRKPFIDDYEIIAAPTISYDEEWAEHIKQSAGPFLFYSQEPGGMAGFARTLCREGKRALSYCAPQLDDFIEDVKACGLVSNVVINNQLATLCYTTQAPQVFSEAPHAYHLEFGERGNLDDYSFIKNRPRQGQTCHVAYAALNFRDVMSASGKINKETFLGFSKDSSGIGMEFSGYLNGERVMGIGLDALANTVQTDFYWKIPTGMDLAGAATIPVAYLTVYYAFFERAKIHQQHKVLIHGGSGAVGQAAIHVALSVGCEVFTTCQQSKRDYLKNLFPELDDAHIGDSRSTQFEWQFMEQTQGKGVDIILNSLADDKLQASLRCLAQHGVFIEIGKYDLMRNTPIGMKHLLPNTTVCGVDVDQIFADATMMERLSSRLLDGITRGVVMPLDRTVFEWSEIPEAFRFLGSGKHIGKVLLDMQDAAPASVVNRFYTTGVHLVVGGLGGFGMALAEWLVASGAEHLILVTRSGVSTGEKTLFMERLGDTYPQVKIEVSTVDLIQSDCAKQFIKNCPPLTGVYNLSLALNDAYFDGMTKEKWEETVNGKVQITHHLDQLTRDHPINNFVCFSSLAVHGNPGQSNYAFANNAMESMCYARQQSGYPAMVMQWGAVGNVGFVSKQDASMVERLSQTLGTSLQSIDSCLAYLETCLLSSPVVNLVYRSHVNQHENAIVEHVDLLTKIGMLLKIDLYSMPDDTNLTSLGMDSLQSAEIQSVINYATQEMIAIPILGKMSILELKNRFGDREGEQDGVSNITQSKSEHINDMNPGASINRPATIEPERSAPRHVAPVKQNKHQNESPDGLEKSLTSNFYDIKSLPQYNIYNMQKMLARQAQIESPYFKRFESASTDTIQYNNKQLINFSSYNYLGYCGDPRVNSAAARATAQYGTSAASSRLVSGEKSIHQQLERTLAELYEVDAAMVFVSGYTTNVSVISHLMGGRDLIIHDSLAHNSIVMGGEFSKARRIAFTHNDMVTLEKLLQENRHKYDCVLIITEGLFSMDGDTAPLARLVELKKQYQCLLMVDEAHSIGVLGQKGLGLREHCDVSATDVDIWMGTLSKSFAGCGGYIAGCGELIEYLKLSVPGFVFSVGLAPPLAGASLEAIELLKNDDHRVKKLQDNSRYFLSLAKENGLDTGLAEGYAIIPIILGHSLNTATLANKLFHHGINVQPIMYPAVEENAARLRFFISALHSKDQIDHSIELLAKHCCELIDD